MVLSRPDILQYLADGKLKIEPAVEEERIAQVSIDLKLGRSFSCFKAPPGYLSSIHIDPSLWTSADLWEYYEQETFLLKPKQLVLATTFERVTIPSDLVGLVEGRSSWARCGITIHVTAPKIDPGFDAQITLEMANFSEVPVLLRSYIDTPAQLMLLQLSTPLEAAQLYGSRPDDRFQGQTSPIPRR